ncbi:MAG: hypothetical protein M1369_06340, partial [Deinococcus sp.]|nr:hypothetical protein [Deinococcus sp.]
SFGGGAAFCGEGGLDMSVLLALLLDFSLGEPPTRAHPVVWMARYIAVLREPATRVRLGQRPMGPGLMRKGLPPSETLVYTLPADPLEFEWDGSTLVLPGFRFYLEGAPEFPETPYYVWREEGYA